MVGIAIAVALHVLAIVIWIGGVAMVTTVLLPAMRRFENPAEGLATFLKIEHRFAGQARATTLLAAATGFYMVDRLGLWSSFARAGFWWLDAMVFVWVLFTVVLFVAEPFILHPWLEGPAFDDPAHTLRLMQRLHWVMLTLSLITVLGAAAGSHGWSGL
jgi:uncharacterized membrane protein